MNFKSLALRLKQAESDKREIPSIQEEYPHLSIAEAYQIQEALVDLHLREGKRIIGPTIGRTSQSQMKQTNVDVPIYGYIFDYMIATGGTLRLSELIHPKVQAGIAFVLGEDIEGPDVSIEQVIRATDYIAPALEVVDSRLDELTCGVLDVIADNASAARVFLGNTVKHPKQLELDLIGVTLSVNGEIKDMGVSAAVLGHSGEALVRLSRMLSHKGLKLKAGQVILCGGITRALNFSDGDVIQGKWDGLGSVEFRVTK